MTRTDLRIVHEGKDARKAIMKNSSIPENNAGGDEVGKSTPAKMSRRRFLALCGGLGAAALGGGILLHRRGWFHSSSPDHQALQGGMLSKASAATPGSPQHEYLQRMRRFVAGLRLSGRASLRIHAQATPAIHALRLLTEQEFTPLSGISVEWETGPSIEILTRVFTTHDGRTYASGTDACLVEYPFLPAVRGQLVDMNALQGREGLRYPDHAPEDFFPDLLQPFRRSGGAWFGMPFDLPIQLLYYRPDLLRRYAQSVPHSLDGYRRVAAHLHGATGGHPAGASGAWLADSPLLLDAFSWWLWCHGGSFTTPDGTPALTDPQALDATRYMVEFSRSMPSDVLHWDELMQARAFARGWTTFHHGSSAYAAEFSRPGDSAVAGQFDLALPPPPLALRAGDACGFGEVPSGIAHRATCMAIPSSTANAEAAWGFVQWATSLDIQVRLLLLGSGGSLLRKSAFTDSRVQSSLDAGDASTRHVPYIREVLKKGLGRYPAHPDWIHTAAQTLPRILTRILTGQLQVEPGLQAMAHAMEMGHPS